jgi:heme exporter protein D
MRVRVMIGAVVGLLASAVVGWAAYGASLAIAPFEGMCITSGGIDDCVPGLNRYLFIGAVGLVGAGLATALKWRWVVPALFLAAGIGSIVADFRSSGTPIRFGWCAVVVGAVMVAGLVMQSREERHQAHQEQEAHQEPTDTS